MLEGSTLHDHPGLHTHSLAENQPLIAKGVVSFQVTGLSAVCLPDGAGAGPHGHPLVGRHGGSSSHCTSVRQALYIIFTIFP